MLGVRLRRFSPPEFDVNAEVYGTQLDTTDGFGTVCSLIAECSEKQSCCIQVIGDPGSGRTTFTQAVCKSLLDNGYSSTQLLFVNVQPGSNEACVWGLFSELAREKQEKEMASVFSQTSVKLLKKLETLVNFLQLHYKLICLDNVEHDGLFLFTLISSALLRATCRVMITCSQDIINHSFIPWDVFHSVHVNGLQEVYLTTYCTTPLLSTQLLLTRTSGILNCNPVALKLFYNFVKEFSLSTEQIENQLRVLEKYKLENEDQKSCHAVQLVLKLVYDWLDQHEKLALLQLSQLRQPLPLLDTQSVDQLVRLSLVAVRETVYSNGIVVYFVTMPTCIQKYFQEEFSKSEATGSIVCDQKDEFDVLQMWLSLISKELFELVESAECGMWPFVPEKWQYIPMVGAAESYNVKELITCKNAIVTSLTELDVMQECLHHAIVMKRYSKLAALVFVMDRFMYWQEGSRSTMKLVDFLQSHSPQTPISPQLVIRKARVMKNDGDLQGAERTLDMLLMEKEVLGKWSYKEEHDHRLVSAVCVQIKGDIQYTLGQWVDAARLLLNSIAGFGSLPKPDKKGLSSSYGLLASCLQNMSVPEYLHLAPSYNLVQGHPLLEAYRCCTEAAYLSQFTPMFFSRHKGMAGAILLDYAKQLKDETQRQMALQAAIQDLKTSIQSHLTISSLTSREEFFLFNCALFRVSLASRDYSSQRVNPVGETLLLISKILYEHYCLFGKVVLLDGRTTELISLALNKLGLEQFTVEEVSGVVQKPKGSTGTQEVVFGNVHHTMHGKQEARVDPLAATKERGVDERDLSSSSTSNKQFGALGVVEAVECTGKADGKPLSTLESVKQSRAATTLDQNAATKEDISKTESSAQMKSAASFTQDAPTKERSSLELVEQLKRTATLSQIAVTQELPIGPESSCAAVTKDTASSRSKTGSVVVDQEAVTKDTASSCSETGWSAVDHESVTKETASYGCKTGSAVVDQEAVTKDTASSRSETGWSAVDQAAVIKETPISASRTGWVTVGPCDNTKGNCAPAVDNSIIAQRLEEEIAKLSGQLVVPGMASFSSGTRQLNKQLEKATSVKEAVAWKYDPIHETWKNRKTLVFVGSALELAKDKKGSQREAFTVEYIDQDDPMGRYVAKQYKKPKNIEQYRQDIMCQMKARYYVGLFNQQLYQSGIQAGSIQFLPVALLQLMNNNSDVNTVYNVEPFMAGEFTKLTNNLDFAWRDGKGTDLVLAFGHFTYQASDRKLIIVDIQGWVPDDNRSCMFLTDPQIHSPVYKCFGTGNFGRHGFERFWSKMHPKCNSICERLGLERPFE